MASKRSKGGWLAPRDGGYSAVSRNATTGRFVTKATAKKQAVTTVSEKAVPPKGRGSASVSGRSK
jgi:hypothetical protein